MRRILVTTPKEGIEGGGQIEAVQAITMGRAGAECGRQGLIGADLDVTQVSLEKFPPQGKEDGFNVRLRVHQDVAVVRERKGDQPASREPAFDVTENGGVSQDGRGRGSGERDRLVSISTAQRGQPSCCMKS